MKDTPVFLFLLSFICSIFVLVAVGYGLSSVLLPKPLQYFHTPYMEFAIPRDWACGREDTAFICRSSSPDDESKTAIIILTAKVTGDQDSYEEYTEHLKSPRNFETADGRILTSTVESIDSRTISDRKWVVGTQLGSEIPNYRTRYFAAVADDLSVLITFSAHELYDQNYLDDVENLLESLRLFKDFKRKA